MPDLAPATAGWDHIIAPVMADGAFVRRVPAHSVMQPPSCSALCVQVPRPRLVQCSCGYVRGVAGPARWTTGNAAHPQDVCGCAAWDAPGPGADFANDVESTDMETASLATGTSSMLERGRGGDVGRVAMLLLRSVLLLLLLLLSLFQ